MGSVLPGPSHSAVLMQSESHAAAAERRCCPEYQTCIVLQLCCHRLAAACQCASNCSTPGVQETLGQAWITSFQVKSHRVWEWVGWAYTICWLIGLNILTIVFLTILGRASPPWPNGLACCCISASHWLSLFNSCVLVNWRGQSTFPLQTWTAGSV